MMQSLTRTERTALTVYWLQHLEKTYQRKCNQAILQMGVFMLQDLAHVPFGYRFTLHQSNVYSADLADDISSMTDVVYSFEPNLQGAHVLPNYLSDLVELLFTRYQSLFDRYYAEIDSISAEVVHRTPIELDVLVTTLYLMLRQPDYKSETIHIIDNVSQMKGYHYSNGSMSVLESACRLLANGNGRKDT